MLVSFAGAWEAFVLRHRSPNTRTLTAAALAVGITAAGLLLAPDRPRDATSGPIRLAAVAVATIPPTTTTSTTAAPRPPVRPARAATAPRPQVVVPGPVATGAGQVNGYPCGGDLPPCWVLRRESNGNPRAVNARGCSGRGCHGLWQFDPKTWAGYGGYHRADLAPPEVQNAKARLTWAGGRGCSHWAACGRPH